jgi:hypothetical protein
MSAVRRVEYTCAHALGVVASASDPVHGVYTGVGLCGFGVYAFCRGVVFRQLQSD